MSIALASSPPNRTIAAARRWWQNQNHHGLVVHGFFRRGGGVGHPRFRSSSDSRSGHGDRERGARPRYFQRSPRSSSGTATSSSRKHHPPITPHEFLGTAAVLPPSARHLSPCLGAALAVSPLAGNLRRLGQRQPHYHQHHEIVQPEGATTAAATTARDSDDGPLNTCSRSRSSDVRWSQGLSGTGFLANQLFFQMIRESPIHTVRNKSMPAAHLTPGLIGCLLGGHQHHWRRRRPPMPKPCTTTGTTTDRGGGSSKSSSKSIENLAKEALKRDFGIRSNRIYDTQWTGISLARWMDLVVHPNHEDRGGGGTQIDPPKQDDNGDNDGMEVVVTDEETLCHQSLVSALWLVALWGTTPSKESLRGYYEALERVGIDCSPEQWFEHSHLAFADTDLDPQALQASMQRLLEYYGKPVFSSGSENDSDVLARDLEKVCAAIVLQQQPSESSLPPPSVPNGYFGFDGGDLKADCAEVAVREILTFLLWDDAEGRLDPSRLPTTASRDLYNVLGCLEINHDGLADHKAQMQQQQQAWFDLLSDLLHCDYLAQSPNGRAYELAPTSESIAKALWHLLLDDENVERPWTSLHDLARFWSGHRQQPDSLLVKFNRLRHQSNDDGSIIEHELLSLHLPDNSRAMELRLRCDWQKASGMAAVTHLAKPRQERLLDPKQVRELMEICFRNRPKGREGKETAIRGHCDPSLMMLCLALQPEYESPLPTSGHSISDSGALESFLWLATPYGPDRRELKYIGGNDGHESEFDRKMLSQSRILLKERILDACQICQTHPLAGTHLLSWILQESPIVVETSPLSLNSQEADESERLRDAIEQALLSLPTSVLENDTVLDAIEWNWACGQRGRVLTRTIRWKLGKLSSWQAFSQSKLNELVEMASLSGSIDRKE